MAKGLDPQTLIDMRKRLNLTQGEMAALIGLGLRSYSDIENGHSEFRLLHKLAAERTALALAAMKRDPMAAPEGIRQDALQLAETIWGRGAPKVPGASLPS